MPSPVRALVTSTWSEPMPSDSWSACSRAPRAARDKVSPLVSAVRTPVPLWPSSSRIATSSVEGSRRTSRSQTTPLRAGRFSVSVTRAWYCSRSAFPARAYPYPGRSRRYAVRRGVRRSRDGMRASNTFSARVLPGVAEIRATRSPRRAFNRLDFPTFERPRNAISGRGGKSSTSARGNDPRNEVSPVRLLSSGGLARSRGAVGDQPSRTPQ